MPTIIGFVPKNNDLPVFPVGWKEDGTQIDTTDPGWSSECQLLLLDDDEYMTTVIQGNKKPALLVQHLSKSKEHKMAQQEMLTRWGWHPAQIEEFHREESYPFWRDIKELLKSKGDETNSKRIISAMTKRYGNVYALQKLDTLAAWFILFSSTTDVEDKYFEYDVAVRQKFDLLTSDQRTQLGPLRKNPALFLKELNSIASALIACS